MGNYVPVDHLLKKYSFATAPCSHATYYREGHELLYSQNTRLIKTALFYYNVPRSRRGLHIQQCKNYSVTHEEVKP